MKNNTQQSLISPKMTMYKNAMKNKHNQVSKLSEQLQKNQSLAQFHEQLQSQRCQENEKQDSLQRNNSFRSLKLQDLNLTQNPVDVIKLKDILDINNKEIKINQKQYQVLHNNKRQQSFINQQQPLNEVLVQKKKDEKKFHLPIQNCDQKLKENENLDFETPRFFGMS